MAFDPHNVTIPSAEYEALRKRVVALEDMGTKLCIKIDSIKKNNEELVGAATKYADKWEQFLAATTVELQQLRTREMSVLHTMLRAALAKHGGDR